jgi:23S rRNA G2069 N7-methylase RlmK/C1962 C5-methylase RlmI
MCRGAGMGVAAAAGGAKSTTNVDNKLSFLKIAERNYELNSLPHDSRTFCTVRTHRRARWAPSDDPQ